MIGASSNETELRCPHLMDLYIIMMMKAQCDQLAWITVVTRPDEPFSDISSFIRNRYHAVLNAIPWWFISFTIHDPKSGTKRNGN